MGAEVTPEGVSFRVWAPARREVEVVPEGGAPAALAPETDGYFSGVLPGLAAGARYRYRLDGDLMRPDPASRFQPEGPHGPSQVVDPASFRWSDGGWEGVRLPGQVLYELHVGTFTPEGTWAAAARELAGLAELGVTCLELMPVSEFPGRFGWGYDGVDLFAPSHLYGTPDDMRAFVDRAHALGLGVILDVVYNHLGPDGNYLQRLRPRLLHRQAHHRVGRGHQLRRRGRRAGARAVRGERRPLDRRVPPRRPAPRRHAGDLRRLAPSTSWRSWRAGPGRRRGPAS